MFQLQDRQYLGWKRVCKLQTGVTTGGYGRVQRPRRDQLSTWSGITYWKDSRARALRSVKSSRVFMNLPQLTVAR